MRGSIALPLLAVRTRNDTQRRSLEAKRSEAKRSSLRALAFAILEMRASRFDWFPLWRVARVRERGQEAAKKAQRSRGAKSSVWTRSRRC
jgi:hypothetical protein